MSAPEFSRFEHEAMATTFELRIVTDDRQYAGQAAAECFAQLDRLEALLSRYREGSDIACINRLAPGETFRVAADTLDCLQIAALASEWTGGAFDPGMGFQTDQLRQGLPLPARRGHVLFDPEGFAVRVVDAPVSLDLGAIGKGFALDKLAGILGEWHLDRALLIAGGSSLLALDGPAVGRGWEIKLADSTAELVLRHRALGASGTSVKGPHIFDPLSGQSASGCIRAWALAETAAMADALSTAFMVLSTTEVEEVCRQHPEIGAIFQPTANAQELRRLGTAMTLSRG